MTGRAIYSMGAAFWNVRSPVYFSHVRGTCNRCWSLHLNCLGTIFWDRNWVRYNGAMLWRALYVKHNTLNDMPPIIFISSWVIGDVLSAWCEPGWSSILSILQNGSNDDCVICTPLLPYLCWFPQAGLKGGGGSSTSWRSHFRTSETVALSRFI